MTESAAAGVAPRATPARVPPPDPRDAAALLAVDPEGLGGAVLRAQAGPERDAWLRRLKALLPEGTPWRRLPSGTPEGRLLGGLDLVATLAAGRPIAETGLLAGADRGVLVAPMAERTGAMTAAQLAAALDTGTIAVERDGLALRQPARFALIALDEGLDADEAVPAPLADRLAFRFTQGDSPDYQRHRRPDQPPDQPPDIAAARALLPRIATPDAIVEILTGTALALGIASLRAPLLALRAARAAAALAGHDKVTEEDAALAARLVLAPRATRLPAQDAPDEPAPPPPDDANDEAPADPPGDPEDAQALADRVLAAALAAIPPGLLASLAAAPARAAPAGRAGAARAAPRRGRAIGNRRGDPRSGQRIALLDTLRAAAPWQRLRREATTPAATEASHASAGPGAAAMSGGLPPTGQRPAASPATEIAAPSRDRPPPRLQIRRDDFRVTRFKARTGTTAIFVVDASGSAALARLAEAKGAVELLLADCYVRRDRVAVIAFRGRGAELLLPPTNSLVRAKRGLAGLPGGGGTPLAAALDAALSLVDQLKRGGQAPLVVLLTDGRANVARDGTGDRARATGEAQAAARLLRAGRTPCIVLDTSARPAEAARKLAAEMGARYLPLPYADARGVAAVVRSMPAPNSGR